MTLLAGIWSRSTMLSFTRSQTCARWRLVHMSYTHAEIDSYNCMHMQSSSFSLIWRHLRVKDFFQSKPRSCDNENVSIPRRKNNLHVRWIRSERTSRTSGIRRVRSFFPRPKLLSLQEWENNKQREEFVSAALRKIRYHVLLSVWCQPLGVVPECLIPLRLQRRPPERGGSARVHFYIPKPALTIYLSFLSPLSLFASSDFSSSGLTLRSERHLL